MKLRKIKMGIFVIILISAQQVSAATEVSTCSVLVTPGEYVLVNDLSGAPNTNACMVIAASGVKLDCNGFSIINSGPPGSGTVGIRTNGPIADVTVENCTGISQYEVALIFDRTDNSSLRNNRATNNIVAFSLQSSSGNAVEDNNASNNSLNRISLSSSNNNYLARNVAVSSLDSSHGNTVTDSQGGVHLRSSSSNNFVTNNFCDLAGSPGDCFSVIGGSNNTFTNNTGLGAYEGFAIGEGTNNIFLNNRALNNIIGFRLGPTARLDKLIGNTACLNSSQDIVNFGFNEGSDNQCDTTSNPNGIGNISCSHRCAPNTTITFVDGDGDGVPSAFTLSAIDIDGVSQTNYSIDDGPNITYTGGEVPIPTGYRTVSTPYGDVSLLLHNISFFSIDNLGVVERRESGGVVGDYCPQDAGPMELQGCPCGVEVEVTSSSISEPKQEPVKGALVTVFDWTDPTSCAAQNRPTASEFDCDVANSCPTDSGGRCIIGLVCDRLYDVGVQSPQAQDEGFAWRSLGNLLNEHNQPKSVHLIIKEATTD